MTERQIKSGQQIVEEFLAAMEADISIDSETVAAISSLWQQNKLNHNRLQQELEKVRNERLKDGQAQEG